MTHPITNENVIEFIVSDPLNVGFAAIRAAHPGSDAELIAAANAPDGATVPGDPMSPADFFDLITDTDFGNFTTASHLQYQSIVANGMVRMGESATQGKINILLDDYPTSKAAAAAKFTRAASAWESYFGNGSVATASVLDDARNMPPSNPNF